MKECEILRQISNQQTKKQRNNKQVAVTKGEAERRDITASSLLAMSKHKRGPLLMGCPTVLTDL